MHSAESYQGKGTLAGAGRAEAPGPQALGPDQHLHDVVQLCEVHFERLARGDGLTAVRGQSLEEVVGRHRGHF